MYRISLDTTLTEGPSNAYLLPESPVTLVDTGINMPRIQREFDAALAEYDLDPSDVDRVLLTHFHPDHAGLAGHVQQAGGANVYAHEADHHLVSPSPAEWDRFCQQELELLESAAAPAEQRTIYEQVQQDNGQLYSDTVDVTPVSDGDIINGGGSEFTLVHTPGHTCGSCCYQTRDHGLFMGDTLLPVYTPNIGGADVRLTDPLGEYAHSLRSLAETQTGPALPGHRRRIPEIKKRVRDILVHHESQARQLLRVLDERGKSTAWELTQGVYGEVQKVHIVLGVGETVGLLEFLHRRNVIGKAGNTYVPTDSSPSELEAVFRNYFDL
jgi:glyoxylase-like metal-dependent hydrolase (beta-lactamase superfamily II)